MAKLYPPHIEGTLPAFYGTVLTVPFSMNQAVGASEIEGVVAKIKKINSNDVIETVGAFSFDLSSECQASFRLEKNYTVGQYYRVQLAFIRGSEIGYYSTIGVIKYTTLPVVELVDLNKKTTNLHSYEYVGSYTQTDATEKLYSSRIQLFDANDNIIEDSGVKVHSTVNDTLPNRAVERFNLNQDLEPNQIYRLVLTMTSINGLTVVSPRYKIIQRENTELDFDETRNLIVKASVNYEEGSALIKLDSIDKNQNVVSGSFILSRSENVFPYKWERIQRFLIKSGRVNDISFNDYTIEQGKNYIYSIQQYNNYGVYSNRTISNSIYSDFEDLFLLDGERQLKIRFNPKVSSMKNTVLETKVNTIGSKYPFITRNGKVNYKEFSLSGLISYQMDNNNTFLDWKSLMGEEFFAHADLTSDNIYLERTFKLEVLDWLNNGKAKILKTPTEGNYIVRIMGVSMSPNDTLGRMLHNFSCSASEVATFNYEALTKYNFIGLQEPDKTIAKWKTINLSERDKNGNIVYKTGELLSTPIYSFQITDMIPGSKIYINNELIFIGVTGSYSIKSDTPITSLRIPEDAQYSGTLLVQYKGILHTSFDDIRAIALQEYPALQIIGNCFWEKEKITDNIIEALEDIKRKIVSIPVARLTKREVNKIYTPYIEGNEITKESKFYINNNSLDDKYLIDLTTLDPLSLYEVHYSAVGCDVFYYHADEDGNIIKKTVYNKNGQEFYPYTEQYYDPYHDEFIEDSYDIFDVEIGLRGKDKDTHEFINLKETEEQTLKKLEYSYLRTGDGILTELMVFLQDMEYSFETEHEKIAPLRKEYDNLYSEIQTKLTTIGGNVTTEDYKNMKQAYKKLIMALDEIVKEKYKQGG